MAGRVCKEEMHLGSWNKNPFALKAVADMRTTIVTVWVYESL